MTARVIVSGPHAHSHASVTNVMGLVMLCLTPGTLMGFYQFGWPAVLLFGITLVSAFFWEAVCLAFAGKDLDRFLFDGSAILTAWLLAMTLPPWAPWWIGFIGAFIAIVLGKHVFGGLGQNPFNPAMVARAMLLVALPVQMTTWVLPDPIISAAAPSFSDALAITFGGGVQIDAVSSATTLNHVSAGLDGGAPLSQIMADTFSLHDLFIGHVSGSLGETSALLLGLGGILLIAMRVISWHTPLAVFVGAGGLASLLWLIDPAHYPNPLWHLSSGALVLCAFFIATDYVTSPITRVGQMIYGIGIGLLIVIIRTWGSFPEGAAFAVLLMNACTPLLDEYIRPRVFGRDRAGKPLKIKGANE